VQSYQHSTRILHFGEPVAEFFSVRADETERMRAIAKLMDSPTSPELWLQVLRAMPLKAKTYVRMRAFRRAISLMDSKQYRNVPSFVHIWILNAKLQGCVAFIKRVCCPNRDVCENDSADMTLVHSFGRSLGVRTELARSLLRWRPTVSGSESRCSTKSSLHSSSSSVRIENSILLGSSPRSARGQLNAIRALQCCCTGNFTKSDEILELGVRNHAYDDEERQQMQKRIITGRLASPASFPEAPSPSSAVKREVFQTPYENARASGTSAIKQETPPTPHETSSVSGYSAIKREVLQAPHETYAPRGLSTPRNGAKTFLPPSTTITTPISVAKPLLTGLSTVSKLSRNDGSSVMTTPSYAARPSAKSQSTTRKSSLNSSRLRTLGKRQSVALV